MIEELATVVKVEKNQVWVSTKINSGCGGCLQKNTCTSSFAEQLFPPQMIEVDSNFPLAVGDQVMVTIDESSLLNAALLLYLLPLLAMFLGAGIAESLTNIELYIVAAGLGSSFFALGCLHFSQKNGLSNYCLKARVVKVVSIKQ